MASSDLKKYIKELKPVCGICHKNPSEEIHHIDHDQKNNSVANLQAVCRKCHYKHGGREIAPRTKIFRIIEKSVRERNKYRYWHLDPFKEIKKFLATRCPIGCACLKHK